MASDFTDFPTEIVDKASFNDASFQMRRISEIQSNINNLRTVPLNFNPNLNTYNYQLLFSNLCSLLFETWGKMTTKEREEAERIRKLGIRVLRVNPPHKTVKNITTNMPQVIVDPLIWNELEELLIEFEKTIKVSMDKHGLSNPSDAGSGLFAG
jgi:hypothetical protein